LAALYHNLGGLEHERGRFARGEPFARKSVLLRRRALGPRHPDVAADLAALAALLDAQRKDQEAGKLYRRARSIFSHDSPSSSSKTLGRGGGSDGQPDYEVAVISNNLAAIKQRQGKTADAEQLYRKALALKQ